MYFIRVWYLPILVSLLQFNLAPFNNALYESTTIIYPFSCWCVVKLFPTFHYYNTATININEHLCTCLWHM